MLFISIQIYYFIEITYFLEKVCSVFRTGLFLSWRQDGHILFGRGRQAGSGASQGSATTATRIERCGQSLHQKQVRDTEQCHGLMQAGTSG